MSVDHKAIHLALRNQLLTLASLPSARAWENMAYKPVPGTPFIEEDYVPGPVTQVGMTTGGTIETTGLYVVRWYMLADTGLQSVDEIDALLALFPPGSSLTAGSHAVRVRGDPAPFRGQLLPVEGGWTACTITIPWRVYSANS